MTTATVRRRGFRCHQHLAAADLFTLASGVRRGLDQRRPATPPVVITGAAVGTPGTEKVFDDGNLARLLRGEQLIGAIPASARREIAERHIRRLIKHDDGTLE